MRCGARIQPEYLRTAPDGEIVVGGPCRRRQPRPQLYAGARAGYVSFQVIAKLGVPGDYSLEVTPPPGSRSIYFASGITHSKGKKLFPRCAGSGQDAVPFASARAGQSHRRAKGAGILGGCLDSGRRAPRRLPAAVSADVERRRRAGHGSHPCAGRQSVPSEDVVTIDHNSYGSSWIGDLYPQARERAGEDFYRSDAFFQADPRVPSAVLRAPRRVSPARLRACRKGRAGVRAGARRIGPEQAHRRIGNCSIGTTGRFLTASAFAGSRRGAKPIPFAYLPINPEWPASYLWWGEAGYEAEFVNVVSAMERHFREKNWTRTRLELFFNHKKRYMGFPWDGDEVRFPERPRTSANTDACCGKPCRRIRR